MTSLVTEAKVTSYEVYLSMLWSLGDDIFHTFEFNESTLLYNLGSTRVPYYTTLVQREYLIIQPWFDSSIYVEKSNEYKTQKFGFDSNITDYIV